MSIFNKYGSVPDSIHRHFKAKSYKNSKYPHVVLILISFTESCIFFIPTYVAFVAMCIYNKSKIHTYIVTTTLASVIGGVVGYYIGYLSYDSMLADFIDKQGFSDLFFNFKQLYAKYGILTIFIGGFTPIPYKIIAISSGIFKFNILLFILLSLFSRGIKFLLIGLIIKYDYKNLLQNLKKSIK